MGGSSFQLFGDVVASLLITTLAKRDAGVAAGNLRDSSFWTAVGGPSSPLLIGGSEKANDPHWMIRTASLFPLTNLRGARPAASIYFQHSQSAVFWFILFDFRVSSGKSDAATAIEIFKNAEPALDFQFFPFFIFHVGLFSFIKPTKQLFNHARRAIQKLINQMNQFNHRKSEVKSSKYELISQKKSLLFTYFTPACIWSSVWIKYHEMNISSSHNKTHCCEKCN